MEMFVVAVVAGLAALLTFFTGFGLGTILLPVFGLFAPIESAVAMTAIVHLANGLVKLGLVARHVQWRIVAVFGLPALAGALLGAWVLLRIATLPALAGWTLAGRSFVITPVKLVIGVLLALFALAEFLPTLRRIAISRRWLAAGGLLSGFFGGLAGLQGALRTAFLARSGLSKEAFVGTAAAIASLVDLTRLAVYLPGLPGAAQTRGLLVIAIVAAVAGTVAGTLLLAKVPARLVEWLVAALLMVFAAGLASGIL
jgi:uncharacterized membrane protein YfcA